MSDHTPPHDMAAEQATLGAMLVSRDAAPEVAGLVSGQDYYRPAHETIHEAIQALHARREPTDMVTVAAELERAGELQRVGGAPYLHTLASEVPLAANAVHYARQVLDKAVRRRLVEAGTQLVGRATTGEGETLSLAEDCRQLVDAAASSVSTQQAGVTVGDAYADALDWLDTEQGGLETPWPDVDRLTNGLPNGAMVTVGARPGHGKSVIGKDLAVHAARQGIPVHLATLEMSRNDYMARILAGLTGVPLGNMLGRKMSDGEWRKVGEAHEKLQGLPLYLDDRADMSMAQLRAGARETQRRYGGLGLVVLDYLQLVRPRDLRLPRREQVDEMSRSCKLLAKELDAPVVVMAQLNRGGASRSDPRPIITDLREAGGIEQDSDQVWLLHRPDQYDPEDRMGEQDVLVAKNRNGPTGQASLAFQGHYARAVSMV